LGAFEGGLAELGWRVGRNLDMDYRAAGRDAELFRASSILSGEELLGIKSMNWKNDELRIIYYHSIPQGQSEIFYMRRPWIVLYCNFRDNLETAPAHTVSVNHSYDIRFLNGKTTEESIEIVVIPPADAKYVAIQCGRIETIPILIADKPDPIVSVLDWLRVLFK
jgi:hypothetical protein